MKKALIILLCAALGSFAYAQGYPSKPVRIIAPYTPGSSIDIFCRIIAPSCMKRWASQ